MVPDMKFVVYDSLTRKKQPLLAAGQQTVGIYVCGPTVYQRIHIGNGRTYAMFAAFVKYLRHIGLDVTYVSNITDVNDKIYDAAVAQKTSSEALAQQATSWYVEDTNRFGLGRPDHEPTASGTIAGQIALIEDLIERDAAYPSNGDVYFRVSSFKQYGRLSNRDVEELIAESRDDLEGSGSKESPQDFALWKATKSGEDTSWDSPWGKGRPGWHIECSVMAEQFLGASFDVHGGGLDLIFPHHENEIAQSRGAGRDFARLWMHTGMLEIGGDKMSKSEGNIASLADVLDQWPAHVVLLYFFSASYRNPLEYSDAALEEAQKSGDRITESIRRADRFLATVVTRNSGDPEFVDTSRHWEGLHEALHDDFNTANAMGELFGLVHDLNTAVAERATPQLVRDLRQCIIEFCEIFALEALMPEEVELTGSAQTLLDQREAARAAKDFDKADQLREQLRELGFDVRDTPDGVDVVKIDANAA
jgi:cysteinyl-tRNA synthetase